MRTTSILCLLASLGHAAWPTRAFFTGGAYNNGVRYRFATAVEPPASDPRWGNGIGGGFRYFAGKEHRALWDRSSHVFFGYDLSVEQADNSGRCRVTIAPLSLKIEEFGDFFRRTDIDMASYKPLSLPTYPVPQIVHPEDAIALDLLVSPDGRQKVVDYIQVSCREVSGSIPTEFSPKTSLASAARPRDLSVQDVELRVTDPELTVNGRRIESGGLHGQCTGNVLWFYVPGKGRFLLSLAPYQAQSFRLAGTLRGTEISFQHGGDRYQVRSAEPLFQSDQLWNLYMRTDASYPSKQEAAFGAAERPEQILTNR